MGATQEDTNGLVGKPATKPFRFIHCAKTYVVEICILLALLSCVLLLFFVHHKGVNRLHFYQDSAIGCDFSNSIAEADGVVRISENRVCYFFGFRSTSKSAILPSRVDTFEELPWVYDAMQFMVDDKGVLIAKGWCGETTHIQTRKGPQKGSGLNKLDELGGP